MVCTTLLYSNTTDRERGTLCYVSSALMRLCTAYGLSDLVPLLSIEALVIVYSSNASLFHYCFENQMHTVSMRRGDQRPRFPPGHDSDDPGFPNKGRDLHRFRCESNADGNTTFGVCENEFPHG